MKRVSKIIIITVLLIFMQIVLTNQKVFSSNIVNIMQKKEYSEEFKKWLELPEEKRKEVLQPRMYDIPNANSSSKNLFYRMRMLGASNNDRYSLKEIIPTNVEIRNQKNTNSCWAFAALSSLETNMALLNYRRGIENVKTYDFSERHLEYATSKTFKDDVINDLGYNREVGSGGNWGYAESYLTNGSGAISEEDMQFENNENQIDISEIKNKTIASQVYDTVDFPDYQNETGTNKTQIMNKIKQHIQDYGAVFAFLHGDSASEAGYNCYNNETGAKFCNDYSQHMPNHAISIVGWDDNYSINSFAENMRPQSKGAWIIRNSWGEKDERELSEIKELYFTNYQEQCIQQGWTDASKIPNQVIESIGFTIEGNKAYMKIGDNGFMYVSYEDCNISKGIYGIMKSTDYINYENIYQYDKYYPGYVINLLTSKIMLSNIFNKKTQGIEYLTQVSLYASEKYTCKVYVNPNGSSNAKADLKLVQLKDGESETFSAGYHTLEFLEPIEIKSNSFVVAIEIQGENTGKISCSIENPLTGVKEYSKVTVENGKCFLTAIENEKQNYDWVDIGKISELNPDIKNGDSTIKAFTTSKVIDDSLKNIEIKTPPEKTTYIEGQDFDSKGMVVQANFNNGTSGIINSTSYSIINGKNLKATQKSVTIAYEDKTVEQSINVEKNSIIELTIKQAPTKTQYNEGEDFNPDGMIIEATYKDGTTKTITDYKIENGYNVKNNQEQITISYEGIIVQQEITVTPNPLVEIIVAEEPDKTTYVEGQDFDKTGMVITGIYEDESEYEIHEYNIENGTDLTKEQTYVTIEYENKTVNQQITVEEKSITEISISQLPTKLKYIKNKEQLDLTGGKLKITYNDETTEEISLASDEISITGFNNTSIGKAMVTVTYESKTTQFEVEIIEEEKAANSKLDNIKCNVKGIKGYFYTDGSKNEYILVNIEIDDITKNTKNDSLEYYYYLSSNGNEQNITKWVKITEVQNLNNKLEFTIDTRKISNFEEMVNEDEIYLYIREVAIKGEDQKIDISKPIKIEKDENTQIEVYIDDVKMDNTQIDFSGINGSGDKTTAHKELPRAGIELTLMAFIVIVLGIGIFMYIKYKNLSKYIK